MHLERKLEKSSEGPLSLKEQAPLGLGDFNVTMTVYAKGLNVTKQRVHIAGPNGLSSNIRDAVVELKEEEAEPKGVDPQDICIDSIQFDLRHPQTETTFVLVAFLRDEQLNLTGGHINRLQNNVKYIHEAIKTSVDFLNDQAQDDVGWLDKWRGTYEI